MTNRGVLIFLASSISTATVVLSATLLRAHQTSAYDPANVIVWGLVAVSVGLLSGVIILLAALLRLKNHALPSKINAAVAATASGLSTGVLFESFPDISDILTLLVLLLAPFLFSTIAFSLVRQRA